VRRRPDLRHLHRSYRQEMKSAQHSRSGVRCAESTARSVRRAQ
jgi:hypothetical protein